MTSLERACRWPDVSLAEAILHPAHQVVGVKNADNVFGPALRIVNRNAGVFLVGDALESFVDGHVAGERKDVRPGHHDFADEDVFQVERALDHSLLWGLEDSGAMAGRYDEFEFLGGMDSALADLVRAEGFEHHTRGSGHHGQQRSGEGHEDVHGAGDGEGNGLGALQGEGLGHDLAQDHVHVGDEQEGDRDADGVGVESGMRQAD